MKPHTIEKLDADSLLVLKKCCPHLRNISSFQVHENTEISSCQLVDKKDRIRDLLITKEKELKISWNADYKACNDNIFYFQVLLESEFGISQLRQKFSSQPTEGWRTDLLELDNEFMPLFIVHFNQFSGVIDSINLVPFPSALRGSYHYAELVNDCSEFSGISAIDEFVRNFINTSEEDKIEQISIFPGNYDVGIVYSNEDFRRWINIIHNISIIKKRLPSSDNVLMLPPNSYPTISLILNGFTRSCESTSLKTSNILITDDSDYTPLYRLSAKLPLCDRKENVGQEVILPSVVKHGLISNTETILSILQSNNSHLALHPILNPSSNFLKKSSTNSIISSEILVVVKVTEATEFSEEFLLSLVNQYCINVRHIVFLVHTDEEDKLKEKFMSIASKWKWEIKVSINCHIDYLRLLMGKIPNTLFINQYVIVRDPNTLRILVDNLTKYQSFSSGCMLNHMHSAKKKQLISNHSAGLYLLMNSYSDTGRISLQAKNIISTIPPCEIYVLSNHYDLSLYKSESFLSNKFNQFYLNNLDLYLAKLSCEASLKGLHNVCTTKVSANYFKSPTLNMTLTIDTKTSQNMVDNLSYLMRQITSLSNLLA